jgi:hypothetical protein
LGNKESVEMRYMYMYYLEIVDDDNNNDISEDVLNDQDEECTKSSFYRR